MNIQPLKFKSSYSANRASVKNKNYYTKLIDFARICVPVKRKIPMKYTREEEKGEVNEKKLHQHP